MNGKARSAVLFYPVRKLTWVAGMGYSPGAVQRRILCMLNSCLRLLMLRIDDRIYYDGSRIMSNEIAVLKREEGIDRPRNPNHLLSNGVLPFFKSLLEWFDHFLFHSLLIDLFSHRWYFSQE